MTRKPEAPPPSPAVKLPFRTSPTITTETVSAVVNGQELELDFPVIGAITVGESNVINDHQHRAVFFRLCMELADAMLTEGTAERILQERGDTADGATAESTAELSALRILSRTAGIPTQLDAAETRARIHHRGLVTRARTEMDTENAALQYRTATALISRRLPGCEGWQEADTEGLPLALIAAINEFAAREQNGGAPERTAEEILSEMAETLGKRDPAENPSTHQTGKTSSGDAENSGPMPPSSDPIDSPTSLPPTSTRPSRRAKSDG